MYLLVSVFHVEFLDDLVCLFVCLFVLFLYLSRAVETQHQTWDSQTLKDHSRYLHLSYSKIKFVKSKCCLNRKEKKNNDNNNSIHDSIFTEWHFIYGNPSY